MTLLLLAIIYVIFISLGLPDGLLGSAWPAIQKDLHQPLGIGGFIGLVVTLMTIVSSLATSYLVRKLGIGWLLVISTLLTTTALLGFSLASNIYWLFLLAVPLGLGAGAIDSALNDYVAKHYAAHHMNWLHAFWGVGATLGPIIFASSLAASGDWHDGYQTLGMIQAGIVAIILCSVPLWTRVKRRKNVAADHEETDIKFILLLRDKKILYSFLIFLLYTGIEVGVGLWLASYLVTIQLVTIESASLWAGIYYGAITAGRLLTGFLSLKVSSELMIRAGLIVSLAGAVMVGLAIDPMITIIGIALIGLGFAPVYPGLIHITPERFGRSSSSKVMSLQMVGGYIGASIIPPLIGLVSNALTLQAFIIMTPVILASLLASTEILNRLSRAR